MITGRVPFSDFDQQTILSQHLKEPVRPPSQSRHDVPPALEAIVLRLLEKNPRDRFASAQEVCHALEQVSLPISAASLSNLPQLSSAFSKYENEIAQIRQLLESQRSVTIPGDDELLALATGAQLQDAFSDGVWCVDLKPVDDPVLVLETVASTFGVPENPHHSRIMSLIEHLREKNLLLLLLHCEHLPGACAQLTETILRTCPAVYILAMG
jgi:serine/threonine protein kinase